MSGHNQKVQHEYPYFGLSFVKNSFLIFKPMYKMLPQIETLPKIGFISDAIKLLAWINSNIPISCGALKSWLKFIGGALVQKIELKNLRLP
jgi:hypothetical protein